MSAITAELARLIEKMTPNSTVLDLRGYGLETLPEDIGTLTYLTKLNLNGNRLTNLPESIGNLTNLTELYLNGHKLTTLPESIGNLTNLTRLDLNGGFLRSLPDSITNLINLIEIKLSNNKFDRILDILFRLPKLQKINLDDNPLTDLFNIENIFNLKIRRSNTPSKVKISQTKNQTKLYMSERYLVNILEDLDRFTNLVSLNLNACGLRGVHADEESEKKSEDYLYKMFDNILSVLSKSPSLTLFKWDFYIYPPLSNISNTSYSDWGTLEICFKHPNNENNWMDSNGKISDRSELEIIGNRLKHLPNSLIKLKCLYSVYLGFNPLTDLSILNKIPNLSRARVVGADLSRRYWTKLSEWKAEWLLNENNAEIRRRIIEQVGYEKICEQLNAINLDSWREYTLLKIDNFQPVFEYSQPSGKEPILLLKMTCPSTGHVHILRVPPDMTSAEDAIVWVNHGIHPDRFTVQT